MLLIVAHHYVVNSGLIGRIPESANTLSASVMLLFGAWGKTGINCFVLITGYFMCRSSFSLRKLLKLYLQILFYALIIYAIFCISGLQEFSAFQFVWKAWPLKSISDGFTSCFVAFYLFIPVLNALVNAMSRQLHKYLIVILLAIFSLLPTCPLISVTFNYVTWFMALYVIASYIRLYGLFPKITHAQWGWIALGSFALGSMSVLCMQAGFVMGIIDGLHPYFFISDSNKILSVAIAVSSFMYFKDMKVPYSRLINMAGASTFGVLLIHANSDTMRQWLWRDTVDCVGHFSEAVLPTLGYALASVLLIFIVCSAIDTLRAKYIEPWLLDPIYNKSKALYPQLD